jgi:hypothetical protein
MLKFRNGASYVRSGSISKVGARNREVCLVPMSRHRRPGHRCLKGANFSREPPFLLPGLSYMRDLPTERADGLEGRIDGVDGGDG